METKGVYIAKYKTLEVEYQTPMNPDTVSSRRPPTFLGGPGPPHPSLSREAKQKPTSGQLLNQSGSVLPFQSYFLNEEHLLPASDSLSRHPPAPPERGGESKMVASMLNQAPRGLLSAFGGFFFGHTAACGINQHSNPCLLHWKPRVLTTGPPGKSLLSAF